MNAKLIFKNKRLNIANLTGELRKIGKDKKIIRKGENLVLNRLIHLSISHFHN